MQKLSTLKATASRITNLSAHDSDIRAPYQFKKHYLSKLNMNISK